MISADSSPRLSLLRRSARASPARSVVSRPVVRFYRLSTFDRAVLGRHKDMWADVADGLSTLAGRAWHTLPTEESHRELMGRDNILGAAFCELDRWS
jgi:hypothetical protein